MMKPAEIDAMINLLGDPDREVFSIIAGRLINEGAAIVPALEKAWEQPGGGLQQERIENILAKIQSDVATRSLQNWIESPYHSLLEGAYWIAKQSYPNIHLEDLQMVTNDICKDVWVNLQDDMLPAEKIKTLNFFFFHRHHFAPAPDDFLLPQYNYINQVIDTHYGNPMSLNLLYLHIAQQAGLPLHAICLPRNFILGYTDENDDILFYVNAYQQGAMLYKKDLDLYFRRLKLSAGEHFYRPQTNTTAILRLLELQIYTYERENNEEKAEIFRTLLPLFGEEKSYFND